MNMKNNQRRGSALLVVLGIILVISIASGALSYSATQQMHAAKVTRETLKARLIAESGLNKAFLAVKNDFSLAATYTDEAAFDDGSFSVRAVPLLAADGSALANRAQLVSQGECGIGRSVVTIDLENRPVTMTGGGDVDGYFGLPYDLLVGGEMDLKGNFNAFVTLIHANGKATIKGSAYTDAKVVSSASTVTWKKTDGTVQLKPYQPSVTVCPEALTAAINSLIAYAVENGAVYADGDDIPEAPPGGVAYCTGSDVRWSGEGGTGCFIFAGDVAAQGGGHWTVTSVSGFPAIIVLGAGEVHINANTIIHGAVLLPNGSIKFNGNAAIYGPILTGQGMTGVGTADLYAGDGQGFNLPPDETTTDRLVITAWH